MSIRRRQYWVTFVLILGTAIYSYFLRYQRIESPRSVSLAALPDQVGDWAGQDFFFDDNVLNELKADQTFFRRYANSSGEEVWLFVGYWASQKYGAQPHSPLHCLPGSGWNVLSNEVRSVSTAANGHRPANSNRVNFATISNGKQTESMLYWYQTRSGYLARELDVKLDLARNALIRKPTDAAFVRLTAPGSSSATFPTSFAGLQDFGSAISPHLATALPF